MASSPGRNCLEPTLSRPVGLIEPWFTNRIQSLPLMSPMLFLPDHTTAYSGLLPAAASAPAALNWATARSRASSVPGMTFWVTDGTSWMSLMASTRSCEIFRAWSTEPGPAPAVEAPWYMARSDSAPATPTAARARPRRNLFTTPPMVHTLPARCGWSAPGRRCGDGQCDVRCDVQVGGDSKSDLVDHIIGQWEERCQHSLKSANLPALTTLCGGSRRFSSEGARSSWPSSWRWLWRRAEAEAMTARPEGATPRRRRPLPPGLPGRAAPGTPPPGRASRRPPR